MRLLNIDLCDPSIMAHHFQAAVPQQRLQREHVPTGSQIGDCPGMAKTVGVGILHIGSCGDTLDDVSQTRGIKGTTFSNNKQRSIRFLTIFTFCQVSPKSMSSRLAQIDNPAFSPFCSALGSMADFQLAALWIKITDAKSA